MAKESKSLFITFEGGEGSGKTTQINRLAQALTERKYKVITTREPGGTEEAERIRQLLVRRDGGNWTPMAECLMLYAARHMHLESVIKPALESGKVVISDRFTDSTRAYQGYGHGFPMETIETLNVLAIGGFKPDLTFVLNVDPQEGIARSQRRITAESFDVEQPEDRFEKMESDFHARVNQGFLTIARQSPDRHAVIDASRSMDDIASEILKAVLSKLD